MSARTSWIPPLVGAIVMTLLVAGGDAILGNRLLAHAHAGARLRGSDLLWAVAALTPNFVTLSLWLAIPFWRRQARDPRGGARVTARAGVVRARPPAHGPAATALALMAFVALPAAVAVAAVADHPSAAAALGALALVVAVGLVELSRSWLYSRSGAADLVVDPATRTLRLPRRSTRDVPRTVPWSDVKAVVVDDPQPIAGARRRRRASALGPVVAIQLRGEPGGRLPIGTWPERPAAERFRAWLEAELEAARAGVSRSA